MLNLKNKKTVNWLLTKAVAKTKTVDKIYQQQLETNGPLLTVIDVPGLSIEDEYQIIIKKK